MKSILLLIGVMCIIIGTGCSRNPKDNTKNYEIEGVSVKAHELYNGDVLQEVQITCSNALGTRCGAVIAFNGKGMPRVAGAVMLDLPQLEILTKAMRQYAPQNPK